MERTNIEVDVLDAQPGDRFAFIATNSVRFCGLILARELALVQIRWDDGHESWTALEVEEGSVEVSRNGE